MVTEARQRSDERHTLRLLVLAVFVTILDMRVVVPLLPEMARDLGETVAATGLVLTTYAFAFGVFQLGYGPLGDRIGRLRVIRWAFAGFVIGTALSGFAPSLRVLLIVRAITGATVAGLYPLTLAYIGDTVPYQERQAAVATLTSAVGAALALCLTVGGILGEFVSWRVLYWTFAAVGAVLWLAMRGRMVDRPRESRPNTGVLRQVARNYREVLRLRGARTLYAMVFVESALMFGGFLYVGAYLHERFAVGLLVVGLMLGGYGVAAFAAARVVGVTVRRIGERAMVVVGAMLMGGGFLIVELTPWLLLSIVGTFLMGVGFAFCHSTLQTIMTELAPKARGTALALHAFCTLVGQAIGAAVLARLLTWTDAYDATLLTCGLGLITFALVGGFVLPRKAVVPSHTTG